MEADHRSQAENPANEHVVALVEPDPRRISPALHRGHGLTPARSSNSRASST
jgi:hypothetical protein